MFLKLKMDGDKDADEECDTKLNSPFFFYFFHGRIKVKKPTINKNIYFLFYFIFF